MQSNRLAAFVITVGLAACSAPNAALAPAALPNSVAAKPALALYVANNNGINVYNVDGKRLLRSLGNTRGGVMGYGRGMHLRYTIPQSVKPTALAIGPG
jgi:hypothetical protein